VKLNDDGTALMPFVRGIHTPGPMNDEEIEFIRRFVYECVIEDGELNGP
jgi:hypothetical protein